MSKSKNSYNDEIIKEKFSDRTDKNNDNNKEKNNDCKNDSKNDNDKEKIKAAAEKTDNIPVKRIILLGATGSIGRQALDVIRRSSHLELVGASVHTNVAELTRLVLEFDLKNVCVTDDTAAMTFLLPGVQVFKGARGMEELVRCDCDMVLTSVVGLAGLEATVAAIEAGHDIALANKETLVGAGSLVMALAKEKGVALYPVDSEHSAIFQSLQGYTNKDINRIILTASGGPFRGMTKQELEQVTVKDALKHPNWNMGQKITIDSATLMNKGLEVIEAHWLFDVPPEDIIVHLHPESILHSGVEFKDHSVIAQLGNPDMRLPIQYALNYPRRLEAVAEPLDLFKTGRLTFEKPDLLAFPCLSLAYEALARGGYYPLIVNTADEVAVEKFLEGKLSFNAIPELIAFAMDEFGSPEAFTLPGVIALDGKIRRELWAAYQSRS